MIAYRRDIDGLRALAIERDGVPLYFDRHHLSLSGARLLMAQIPSRLFSPSGT